MQSRRGVFHLLFVLVKIYQIFWKTNNKMISKSQSIFLHLLKKYATKIQEFLIWMYIMRTKMY
ncbi:hypothetical protein DWW88_08610 [Bacteroides cellulosilyticus]|uniref:Uncharacterized protein n=1 Tax=Bacteroides intestinalis TaxID=329854 RepID=A0A139LFV3_9BACE|nr:hypothetical protein HMPREF2531_02389 [Bacteroides intestinalis]RGU27953.1 hypothetical protein DWW88_08610 [Bacteroides cellulosilyticus]